MYRNILVPLDGSPAAERGLQEAIALAAALGSRIKLLHVIDPTVVYPMIAYIPREDMALSGGHDKTLRDEAEALVARAEANAEAKGVTTERLIVTRDVTTVADLIVEAAEQSNADMIVMGTHGRRGLDRLLMGSDAEMVLRNSRVPVLMVREVQS